MPVHSNGFPYAQYFPVDLMDLLFNPEKKFYNSTLADLETSYHLLTSIYYNNVPSFKSTFLVNQNSTCHENIRE